MKEKEREALAALERTYEVTLKWTLPPGKRITPGSSEVIFNNNLPGEVVVKEVKEIDISFAMAF